MKNLVVAVLFLTWLSACNETANLEKDTQQAIPETSNDIEELPSETEVEESEDDIFIETEIGKPCTKSDQCHESAPVCIVLSKSKGIGICSAKCTLDDPSTRFENEDSCSEGNICATLNLGGKTKHYCLNACKPRLDKNTCPNNPDLTCSPSSERFFKTIDRTACWYQACKENKDCPVRTDQNCDETIPCTNLGPDAFCRNGKCALPGNCTASGLCGPHTHLGKKEPYIGAPCKSDIDCGEVGICIKEGTSDNGPSFSGGYCSSRYCKYSSLMPPYACPQGSICNRSYYGGYCFKTCKLTDNNSCRNEPGDNGGDYECYDYTRRRTKGQYVALEPICISTHNRTCDRFGKSGCPSMGLRKNPTQMYCRDRRTGKRLEKWDDPNGVCLDNTGSGPFSPGQ